MENLNNNLNNLTTTMLVKCFTNPNNRDFYIGTLTADKFERIVKLFEQFDSLHIFWSAFHIAETEYLNDISAYLGAEYQMGLYDACPECGCISYVDGVKCPNCDYIED